MSRAFYLGWAVFSLGLAVWQLTEGRLAWMAIDLGFAAWAGWKFAEGGDDGR